jgi:hypothetical protein
LSVGTSLSSPHTLFDLPVQRVRRRQGNVGVRIAGLEVAGIHDGTTPVRSHCLDEPQELPTSLQKIPAERQRSTPAPGLLYNPSPNLAATSEKPVRDAGVRHIKEWVDVSVARYDRVAGEKYPVGSNPSNLFFAANSRTCTNVTPGPRPLMESFSSLLNEYTR